jgi:hypothetical protein
MGELCLSAREYRQTEVHTAELLITEPSSFEVEIGVENLKIYKLPGINQSLAELVQARV